MGKVFTDVIRQVWNDEGAHIDVGPGEDGFGVKLSITDKYSKDWFGEANLSLSSEVALALGEALVTAAKEALDAESKTS